MSTTGCPVSPYPSDSLVGILGLIDVETSRGAKRGAGSVDAPSEGAGVWRGDWQAGGSWRAARRHGSL